jgi:hypothetical protein
VCLNSSEEFVIPKRGLCARNLLFLLPAESRFLADKPGFGMTRVWGLVSRAPSIFIKIKASLLAMRRHTHEKLEVAG